MCLPPRALLPPPRHSAGRLRPVLHLELQRVLHVDAGHPHGRAGPGRARRHRRPLQPALHAGRPQPLLLQAQVPGDGRPGRLLLAGPSGDRRRYGKRGASSRHPAVLTLLTLFGCVCVCRSLNGGGFFCFFFGIPVHVTRRLEKGGDHCVFYGHLRIFMDSTD